MYAIPTASSSGQYPRNRAGTTERRRRRWRQRYDGDSIVFGGWRVKWNESTFTDTDDCIYDEPPTTYRYKRSMRGGLVGRGAVSYTGARTSLQNEKRIRLSVVTAFASSELRDSPPIPVNRNNERFERSRLPVRGCFVSTSTALSDINFRNRNYVSSKIWNE